MSPSYSTLRTHHSPPSPGESGVGSSLSPTPRALRYGYYNGYKKTCTTPRQLKTKAGIHRTVQVPKTSHTSNGYATFTPFANNNTFHQQPVYANTNFATFSSMSPRRNRTLIPVAPPVVKQVLSRRSKYPLNGPLLSGAIQPNRSRYLFFRKL